MRSEETFKEKTDHNYDIVFSEIFHAVVDADPKLDLGGEVGDATNGDAEDDAGQGWDEARCGCGSHETGNAAGALCLYLSVQCHRFKDKK